MINIVKIAFKKDNVLYVVAGLISLAILIFDWFFGDVDASISFEIILFILAFICFAQIAEREIRFSSVELKLDEQTKAIDALAKPTFHPREAVIPFTTLMEDHDELFYTGGHLYHFIHTHTRQFEGWLDEGKSIRLILQNPDNMGLQHIHMPCVNYKANVYREQIRSSLDILKGISDRCPGGRFGVRLSDISPTQSVAIMDGHRGGEFICILHHLPDGESSTAPFNFLDKEKDERWFKIFLQRYYDYLWMNSAEFITHPDDKAAY